MKPRRAEVWDGEWTAMDHAKRMLRWWATGAMVSRFADAVFADALTDLADCIGRVSCAAAPLHPKEAVKVARTAGAVRRMAAHTRPSM